MTAINTSGQFGAHQSESKPAAAKARFSARPEMCKDSSRKLPLASALSASRGAANTAAAERRGAREAQSDGGIIKWPRLTAEN
jgi:hypothetical protein